MTKSRDPIRFTPPEPSALSSLFPGYEIQGLIAVGGMGAVYSAVQKTLDRRVALKILPRELSMDADFRRGFEREAKAMAKLNHQNLIRVYEFGEVEGMLFITMEFVQGKSLHHSAHGTAIKSSFVIQLVTGICNGLAHAHENGVVHRDIKPANVLLTLDAEPKIGDFGLARPAGGRNTEGEMLFGTPGYTAPEVIHAPKSVDHRADIFSVGVMLHELLTGKLPSADPRGASMISHCDPRFDAIIRLATDKNPAARYTSIRQMAASLQQIAAQPAAVPSPVTGAPKPKAPQQEEMYSKPEKRSVSTILTPLIILSLLAYLMYMLSFKKTTVVVIDETTGKQVGQYEQTTAATLPFSTNQLPAAGSRTPEKFDPKNFRAHQGSLEEDLDSARNAPGRPSNEASRVAAANARAAELSNQRATEPQRLVDQAADAEGGVFQANYLDLVAMRNGKSVKIEGVLLGVGESSSRKTGYLRFTTDLNPNFVEGKFDKPTNDPGLQDSALKGLIGKRIRITGTVVVALLSNARRVQVDFANRAAIEVLP